MTCWHILTGEYPPQPGGVADYTALVAAALSGMGDEVHVWAPPAVGAGSGPTGVRVRREAGGWAPADLARIGAALDEAPATRRLLVQYTPYAWGRRGMNLGFCRWLVRRREAGDAVDLMVHEVHYPLRLRDRPWRWLLATAHRRMIREALAAADRVFHSNRIYGELLRRYDPRPGRPTSWLPVPSTVPVVDDPAGVAELRARLATPGAAVVGTFGTYGGQVIGSVLERALVTLLAGQDDRVGLLIGRGGDRYAAALQGRHPGLRGRLVAPGGLPAGAISRYLQACDLLVLPYDDGVSTRRTTAMAALAHGRPIATTAGVGTEPLWGESGAVALAAARDAPALAAAADALLADPPRRASLGAAARALYDRCFALGRTVAALRSVDAPAPEVEPGAAPAYTAPAGPRREPGRSRP